MYGSPPAATGPRAIAWTSSGGMLALSPVLSRICVTPWYAPKCSVR